MVEVILSSIKIDEKNEAQVIVLKEKNGPRCLPIIIGFSEVVAIKRNLAGLKAPRPMTHDLLANVIYQLNARVERVIIDNLQANTFYAKIALEAAASAGTQKRVLVDARPSDSIALAIRVEAPIFVEERVFEALNQKIGGGV